MANDRVYVQSAQRAFRFVRPADVTQYSTGDVIGDSTSAITTISFPKCSGDNGKGGIIKSCMLIDSTDESTNLNCELFIFDTAPSSYGDDNAAFTPTDAEMETLITAIPLDGTTAANIRTGNGNLAIVNENLDIPFSCTITENRLYGVLVARNTYTPVSAEVFVIKLGVQQS